MQGFFYNGNYYLIPEKFKCFDCFYDFLAKKLIRKKHIYVKTILFQQKDCLPPFFIAENTTWTKLKIESPHVVFPAEFEVMTKNVYDKRLREIVANTCKGCLSFSSLDETEESLQRHREEINLNGRCYFRKEKIDPRYRLYLGLEEFLHNLEQKRAKLEELIDKGDTLTPADAVSFFIEPKLGFKPFKIVLFKRKKTYHCCFPCFLDINLALIFSFICQVLNGLSEKIGIMHGWKFLSYLPKGGLGKNEEPPVMKFIFDNRQLKKIDIEVGDFENAQKAYLDLCNYFGENRFLGAYYPVWVKFESKSYGLQVPPTQIEHSITQVLKSIFHEQEIPLPCNIFYDLKNALGQTLRKVYLRSPIFFILNDNEDELFSENTKNELKTDLFTEYGITIGRLSIAANGLKYGDILSQIFEKAFDNFHCMVFAKEFDEKEFSLFFLSGDTALLFDTLARYKPAFDKFSATLKLFEENLPTKAIESKDF